MNGCSGGVALCDNDLSVNLPYDVKAALLLTLAKKAFAAIGFDFLQTPQLPICVMQRNNYGFFIETNAKSLNLLSLQIRGGATFFQPIPLVRGYDCGLLVLAHFLLLFLLS
jgi:hypothetical protein